MKGNKLLKDNWYVFQRYGLGKCIGTSKLYETKLVNVDFPHMMVPAKMSFNISNNIQCRPLSAPEDMIELINALVSSQKIKVKKSTWRSFSVKVEQKLKSSSIAVLIAVIIDCQTRMATTTQKDVIEKYQAKAIHAIALEYSILFNVPVTEATAFIRSKLK